MVLNLYVQLRHAAAPWSLVSKQKAQDPELHHRSDPVPGIYMHNEDGHYLVAMRPKKGRSSDSTLFIPYGGFDPSKHGSTCDTPVPSRPTLTRRGTGFSSVFSLDSIASAKSTTSSFDKSSSGKISGVDICGYRSVALRS